MDPELVSIDNVSDCRSIFSLHILYLSGSYHFPRTHHTRTHNPIFDLFNKPTTEMNKNKNKNSAKNVDKKKRSFEP